MCLYCVGESVYVTYNYAESSFAGVAITIHLVPICNLLAQPKLSTHYIARENLKPNIHLYVVLKLMRREAACDINVAPKCRVWS